MMRGQPRRNRPSLFHRIGLRILLLNVLIVFVPVAIVLLLDTYEEQLLDQLERSLVQQGRTISASLSLEESLDAESAQALLGALAGRHESRIRVLDAGGRLLADTSTLGSAESDETAANRATPSPDSGAEEDPDLATTTREQFIYRFASAPVRSFRRLAGDPDPAVGSADFYNDNSYSDGSEVRAALAGRYGASTRVSSGGQISVTLYSAIPIRQEDRIVGAVLVSQSTFRILQSIYRVRVDLFVVFLVCLGLAVVLSAFLSLTIARPMAQLQTQARNAVDHRGRLTAPIRRTGRRDEIGALSGALSELTHQVESHTVAVEQFASDVAHELKNPLASIGVSCELASSATEEEVRERFLNQAMADVERCHRIIEAIRELSQIDTSPPTDEHCEVEPVLHEAAAAHRTQAMSPVEVVVDDDALGIRVLLGSARLRQVLDNLLDNAIGKSPSGAPVVVSLTLVRDDAVQVARITVSDSGPGIAECDEERIFNRFYTDRSDRDGHLGLGLAIVRAIVAQARGTVTAGNQPGGGACFTVQIPVG